MPRIQPKWAIKLHVIIIEIHNKSTESLYNNKNYAKLKGYLFWWSKMRTPAWKLERAKG